MDYQADRSWMYDRFDRDGYLRDSFVVGVRTFIEFTTQAIEGGDLPDGIRCPCTKCKNLQFFDKYVVRDHLLKSGFVTGYLDWIFHGEMSRVNTPLYVPDSPSSSNTNIPDDPVYVEGPFVDMVVDARGGRYVEDEATNESPNPEARAFYKLMHLGKVPIYPDQDISILQWLAEWLENKTHHKASNIYSDKAYNSAKQGFMPEVRKLLPKDTKGIRTMLETELGYVKYDVCPKMCFLYYGDETKDLDKCPLCMSDRYIKGLKSKVGKKKLWYFPIGPRLQRLYYTIGTAKHMTWHLKCAEATERMIHPASGEAWREFDRTHPDFATEPRNIRLGLCTDGFNPYGSSGKNYSCWPVFVTPYNLPPDLCMRKEFIFLSLLISGPSSPTKNLDLFLRPLIDDLKVLWGNGLQTYDITRKQNFQLRAALMWTISDFPAYGMLSGWSTHGKLSCPYCMQDTKTFTLANGGKQSFFDCHRRFLPEGHLWRHDARNFRKGRKSLEDPIPRKSGDEMREIVNELGRVGFGTKFKRLPNFGVTHNWLRKSIFWELPYWSTNLVRHNLDVMHCEKNFFDNIINTVLDDSKTKDNIKSRKDLKLYTNRRELYLDETPRNGPMTKTRALYCLTKDQRRKVLEWLSQLRFPDGYASNLGRCVHEQQQRLSGMKSHDCHVFMQRLIPIAFRDFLPPDIWQTLVEISLFFKAICASEVSAKDMEGLEKSIVVTMCKLERIFPPSFFDSMEHLAIHLPYEARVCGPVHYRWMYPFERKMFDYKGAVLNKARPEGCIANYVLLSEVSNLISQYLDVLPGSTHRRLNRNEALESSEWDDEILLFRKRGRPFGPLNRKKTLTAEEKEQIELYTLLNCEELDGWVELFVEEECGGLSSIEVQRKRNIEYVAWFKQTYCNGNYMTDARVIPLINGPNNTALTYEGYVVNGFRFRIDTNSDPKETDCSGVYVKGDMGDTDATDFYGTLEEILEVDYWGGRTGKPLSIVFFKCRWYDIGSYGTKVHEVYKLVDINPRKELSTNEPFICANQALQSYYAPYPNLPNGRLGQKGWLSVSKIPPRHIIDMSSVSCSNQSVPEMEDQVLQADESGGLNLFVDLIPFNMNIQLGADEFEVVDEPNPNEVEGEEQQDANSDGVVYSDEEDYEYSEED